MIICEYGCGKEARYQFKNGKWCCEKNRESCPKVKENIKLSCMKKYGVEHPSQNKEVKEKMKKTFMEKYGVKCPSQNKEVKEKTKQTFMKKYGGHPAHNKKVQEKTKQTCMEKYGVKFPAQNKEVKEKTKQTNMEKYRVEHHTQSLEIKKKLLEKHPFFCQVEEIKIEDNEFKVHCKNRNCVNSKEKRGWFTPTPTQIHNRIGALEDETGRDGKFFYCSQYCKDTCDAFNIHSDPNKDTRLPYTQEQLQTFRLEVLTLDNFICQFCGEPATDVHHEIPVKIQPFHSVDPDYGWSCCEKCHYEKGHKKGTECSTGNLAAKICSPVKKKEN
jgi:hypothetical protein